MKYSTLLAASGAAAVAHAAAVPAPVQQVMAAVKQWTAGPAEELQELREIGALALAESFAASQELRVVELEDGVRRILTEAQKLELRRLGVGFMDVTDTQTLGDINNAPSALATKKTVKFPAKPSHQKELEPLLAQLSKDHMRENLEKFTSFHTRYYKSDYGAQSSAWLLGRYSDTLDKSGAKNASAAAFEHPWGQSSIIATIPGKSEHTVVIGAHQDSINLWLPSILAAPGADDDGSGTVTILEALRVLLQSEGVAAGNATNTIEFHAYSAEEGGLLGSQAIFAAYEKQGRKVKAMLQQDMTGYVQGTLDAGEPESVGVITDYVDPGLTEFIKQIVSEYCDIPYVLTKCGYACSDHASASKAGYPSAFVIESDFNLSDRKIHTTEDKIEYLSFDHMLQHAKLTLGLVYELAFADFD